MKILIFGGSFNPVHNEHVNMLVNAYKQFNIDKVIIVPSYISPHKIGVNMNKFSDRFKMLEIAFANYPDFEISDFENQNTGISFTYLTIEHFASLYPGAELFFMVGTDMLYDFPSWKNPDRILDLATLIVTRRTGDDFVSASENYYSHFDKKFLLSTYIGTSLSSTKVNNYLKLGLDTSELISSGVYDYIADNNLATPNFYEKYVISSLKPKRLIHTANVMTLAKRYAKMCGVDTNKAEMSALLHDVAKYKSVKDYPEFSLPESVPEPVVHQYLGAYVAQKELGICDGEILDAIRYHTSGRRCMSKLEKIIYLADMLEEGRSFPGIDEIRLAVEKNFEKGFYMAVNHCYQYLKQSGGDIYELTSECLLDLK